MVFRWHEHCVNLAAFAQTILANRSVSKQFDGATSPLPWRQFNGHHGFSTFGPKSNPLTLDFAPVYIEGETDLPRLSQLSPPSGGWESAKRFVISKAAQPRLFTVLRLTGTPPASSLQIRFRAADNSIASVIDCNRNHYHDLSCRSPIAPLYSPRPRFCHERRNYGQGCVVPVCQPQYPPETVHAAAPVSDSPPDIAGNLRGHDFVSAAPHGSEVVCWYELLVHGQCG